MSGGDRTGDGGFPLGAPVALAGVVIGRSEFREGPPSYLVEFVRKGRTWREWFLGADLLDDAEDDADDTGGGE